MKISAECILCNIDRAKYECDLCVMDEGRKIEILREVAKFISQHATKQTVPAFIGTWRERIVKRMSGVEDPYAELKRRSNEVALALLEVAEEYCGNERDMNSLLKLAAASNSMEYGVMEYEFDEKKFRQELLDMLKWDVRGNVGDAVRMLEKFDEIIYLTDNCGEVVFDCWIAERLGKDVVMCPKSSPVLNDATVEDVRWAGYGGKIVPAGDWVGVFLEHSSREFRELLWDENRLIVAKGMGNYETLTEIDERLRGRLIYIFRAKCSPVARSAGVSRGELVVLAKT